MNPVSLLSLSGERRSANWKPSSWDSNQIHQSLKSDFNDLQEKWHTELKQAVEQMLEAVAEPLQKLTLIDDIQRLGVAYRFEKQIDDALSSIYSNYAAEVSSKKDLLAASLYFRLLRQHGCYVSPDIFIQFKDEAGQFKASLGDDVEGLLSLYEASYLGIKGETILDDAKAFSTSTLENLMPHVEADIASRISHALHLPLHWNMRRMEARLYIDVYRENKKRRNDNLLEFARLDFNMLQVIHQRDLKDVSFWWDFLDLPRKLGFIRDRLMESFIFSVGLNFEPQFSECRKAATKDILLITVLDDIYDIYGSMDEVEIFNNAVNRWDLGAVDELPEYMQLCYLGLLNSVNELAYVTMKDTGRNVLDFLKKLWKRHFNAAVKESRWFHRQYTPTLEEYMENAQISIGAPLVLTHAYVKMLKYMPNEDVNHVDKYLKLISMMCYVFRLYDDWGTSKAEIERGDVPKAIQCYMHEAKVSEEIAREHIKNIINERWKELNEECLKATDLNRKFVAAVLDALRAAAFFYHDRDGFGEPDHKFKSQAMALFSQQV
uniref:Sesquiterpene synthase TPS3 n=1 Tax=Cananga odorata TaxID=13393 RepID=TPS3_CANOD|nr:RecName: Full=Sesquiterpene synthase TPS3; AltName: Full=Alpha-bergamotene synthase TPS3; AltName: Full=Terpene synthase 3; Short=CoTPS3 [Cananga odorata]QMW48844.1 terpene synthase 3 [Cananga odorata]